MLYVKNGSGPLHVAAEKSSVVAVRLLLLYGADVNIKDNVSGTNAGRIAHVVCSDVRVMWRVYGWYSHGL